MAGHGLEWKMLSYMPVISAVGDVAGNLWVTLTEGWRGHGRVAGTSREQGLVRGWVRWS